MDPEVEPVAKGGVAAWEHVSQLVVGERLVGGHGVQSLVLAGCEHRFHVVGEHDVHFGRGDRARDGEVVLDDDDRGVLDVLAHECLVGATRIDTDSDARAIDGFQIGEALAIGFSDQGTLAEREIRVGQAHDFLALERAGDPRHRDVVAPLAKPGDETRPTRLDEPHLDAERFTERVRGIDVDAFERSIGATQAEGPVVARSADVDVAALDDRVEM